MAVTNFIPKIWSARMMVHLDKALVFGSPMVVNRDYEGEISDFGDTVKINQIGDITISDYTPGTDLASPEDLTDAQTELKIDQAKYFNFKVNDVDDAQTKPKLMDTAMSRAGYNMADAIDQNLANHMVGNVPSANSIGTVAVPKTDLATSGKARQYIRQAKTVLDENNVPNTGRFVIMPPWYGEKLGLDSTYIMGTGTPQSEERLRTGNIEMLDGFMLLVSNNCVNTNDDAYRILFGTNLATSVAFQVVKTEAYRPEKRFEDAVKGLTVFGRKVLLPASLGMIVADRP